MSIVTDEIAIRALKVFAPDVHASNLPLLVSQMRATLEAVAADMTKAAVAESEAESLARVEGLERALALIRDAHLVEMALDPEWQARFARAALSHKDAALTAAMRIKAYD